MHFLRFFEILREPLRNCGSAKGKEAVEFHRKSRSLPGDPDAA
jgi:hypothetical protein